MGICGKVKSYLQSEEDSLPWKTLIPTMSLFLCNGMAMTTVYSYLPKLIQTFGVSEVDIGQKTGLVASSYFIGNFLFSLAWGILADKIGKKKTLCISACAVLISTFLFGMSQNYWWLLSWRFMQGLSSGIIPISKSIIVDICSEDNVAKAFSLLFACMQGGLIIGPGYAGYLSFPAETYPSIFKKGTFWERYKIFIPNLILSILILPATIACALTINNELKGSGRESLNLVQKNEDTKSTVESFISFSVEKSESSPLIGDIKMTKWQYLKKSKLGTILSSRDVLFVLFLYLVSTFIANGTSEMTSVVLANAGKYHGFEMAPSQIGNVLLTVGALVVVFQIVFMTRIVQRFGLKKCFVAAQIAMAVTFPMISLIAQIENRKLRSVCLVATIIVMRCSITVTFLIINLILNNASPSNETLTTVNGLGMASAAMGRALGPLALGSIYTWSLNAKKEFPFNEYFFFLVTSLFCLATVAYFLIFIAERLITSRQKEEKQSLTITWSEVHI